MKRALVLLLILSCLWLCSCEGFPGDTIKKDNETTKESVEDTTEDTAKETEPPIGHTVDNPIPFGEYAEIPANKGDLTMKVLEVLGDAENVIIKMNLTVENLKNNARLELYQADFELFCENGLILDEAYGYSYYTDYQEYYTVDQKYNLNIPNARDVTMGGDGSIDFYVYFEGNIDEAKMLTTSYATNKYIYFALS